MYIYKITNTINNKIYIGMSTKDNENYLGSGTLISKAVKKYGKEHFIKEVIEHCDSLEILQIREIFWISYYKQSHKEDCYNLHEGGKGGNWKKFMSEEASKIALDNIKNAGGQWKKGHIPWIMGKKHNQETILKFKESHKGKKQSKQTVEKRVSKLIGKKRNEEQKQNLSKSLKAVYSNGFSKEHKMKLSQSRKGTAMPEETKQKLKKEKVKVECPYCKKIGGYPVMKRYHFENCKLSKQCTE
jgi:hypothetical protein